MVASTLTSSAVIAPPRAVHAGVQARSVSVTANGTVLSSDSAVSFQMFKVPHGATITNLVLRSGNTSATAPIDLGFDGASFISALGTAVALGSNTVATAAGYQVSCSDDAASQFRILTATATVGTTTNTISIQVTCSYYMPQQ